MTEASSHLQIALKSITAFGNDGRLDAAELEQLIAIAEKDNRIDKDEARVLNGIFAKLTPEELTPEIKLRIAKVVARIS